MANELATEAPEYVAFELLDATPIGPIEPDPKPPDLVANELEKLVFAPPMRDALEDHRYFDVVQALDKERLDADEANNLGCAWARLAHEDRDPEDWRDALAALKKSASEAKDDGERQRAENNLAHVHKALRATTPM